MTACPTPPTRSARYSRIGRRRPSRARRLHRMRNFSTPCLRRARTPAPSARNSCSQCAGGALSTTAAAAALERWLETLEEEYAHQPLTDLLKSPFVLPGRDRGIVQP